MKYIRPLFNLCVQGVATSLILAASAYAANVTITTGSTFPNTAPVSTYTAPGGTWTLTFQVASQPVASSFNGGFTATYTNGVFTLNGTPITLTGSSISFYPFSNGGGFSMILGSVTLSVTGNGSPSFFTGSNSSPTMVPGTYPESIPNISFIGNDGSVNTAANTTSFNVVIAAATGSTPPSPTPAPTAVVLVLLGLAALAVWETLRRRQAAA